MINPVFYAALIILVVGLLHVPRSLPSYLARYLAAVLPGVLILAYAASDAFYFAILSLGVNSVLFQLTRKVSHKQLKSYLPYAGLLLLFYPDYVHAWENAEILYLGSAFFIVRQFVTVKESIKKRVSSREQLVATTLATFYFASLFTGPIFSGLDANSALREERPIQHRIGLFKVLEGFAFVLPISVSLLLLQTELAVYLASVDHLVLAWLCSYIAAPLLAFAFVFSTFFGYSKIAEGVANLLGFEVPENFRQPHKAKDFADFWQRWHRSMADFVMKYLYLPISIELRSPRIGLLAAFVFMGLWHNVGWGYFAWGIAHGVALIWLQPLLAAKKCPSLLGRIVTLTYVIMVSYTANVWLK